MLEDLQTEMGKVYWGIRGPEKKRLQKLLQAHPFCPHSLAWEPHQRLLPLELTFLAEANFYQGMGPVRYLKWGGATYKIHLEEDTLRGQVWEWVGEHEWEP